MARNSWVIAWDLSVESFVSTTSRLRPTSNKASESIKVLFMQISNRGKVLSDNEQRQEFSVEVSHTSQTINGQSGSSHAAPALEGKRVLLAEDCVDQGRLYLRFLQVAGAEVTLECNGESAVNAVRKSPTLFDAVVMDFQMPELDGIESTRQLRELGYSGAIIAVTAFGSDKLKQSWFQAGCDEFLLKPLNKSELISAILHHTTTGKQWEEDLLQAKQQAEKLSAYGNILDHSLNEILITDAETFHFVHANHGALKNFGYTMEEFRGLTPLDINPKLTLASLTELVVPLLAGTQENLRFTTTHRRKDGSEFPVDVHLETATLGDKKVFVVIALDMTERQSIETELRQAKQQAEKLSAFGKILDHSLNEIYVADAETLQFVHANYGALRNTGYTMEELRSLTPFDIKPNHTMAYYSEMIAPLLAGTQENLKFETIHRRKDGSEYPVEVHLETSTLSDRKVLVAIILDITERQRNDALIRDSRERAIAADRSKSEFLANMSHEIRTPMTAIMGYADLLLEEINDDQTLERRINDVQIIKRNGEHLLAIIDDILDLSKIEAGKLSVESLPCSPPTIIEEVLSLMRVRSRAKGLALDVVYETLMPARFQSDPTRLRQILVNLVGNAIKFTEIGSVRLMVRLVGGNAPTLEFDVVDAGIGMSPDQRERLFQPFVQADTTMTRKFGGTGLGLIICKRLAEMLGGDVSIVESVPGKGSRFRVAISTGALDGVEMIDPTGNVVTEATKTGVAKSQEPSCSLTGSRILLAEDGPDNQQLISFVIKKAGADITVVENGQLAVDAALQAVEAGLPFHVILMDMQMPVLDGYGAVTLLRAKDYRRPIIALTAHSMSGDREKCVAAGCDDYATKPINKVSLISTCRKWTETAQCESAPADNTAEMATLDVNTQSPSTAILVSELAEDPDIAPLIDDFLSRLSPKVTDMTEYLSTNRLDELAKLAHQLKGSGGGYGFPLISEAAQRVEQQAKSDPDLEQIQRAVAELTSLCQQALAGVTRSDNSLAGLY